MRKRLTILAITASAATLALGPAVASADSSRSAAAKGKSNGQNVNRLQAVGLVDGTRLVRFTTNRPQDTRPIGTVRGLTGGDTSLIGIDYRVQDGKLYGVGNAGGIYTLNTSTAAATFVQRLTVPLEGSFFGVDFNPAANALRIVSDTGQNLRQPFATAGAPTVVDGRLTTPPATGTTQGVTAAAYTNNDSSPDTATTLYDIDTTANTLVLQSPANAGTLAPTGNLTVDPTSDAGFDIYSTVRNGAAVALTAFATLEVAGERGLYEITLFNGRATKVGAFDEEVTDLAIGLDQR